MMDVGQTAFEMAMEEPLLESVIREQLFERKVKLKEALELSQGDLEFVQLLGQVDTALSKLEKGTYGKCEVCSGKVEPERLLADPLVRVCLGELSDDERRSLENDLELASTIQRGLLPAMSFAGSGWKADFVYEPHSVVSGDYCDIIPVDDKVYFILGDVSGKGMAASLLMSNLHAIFHSLAPLGMPLPELMSRANHLLAESSPANQFATLVCAKADSSGNLEIVNAGHLPPVLVKNNVKGLLDFAGLPLGMFADARFATTNVSLHPGDSLVLFTDGVTETVNGDGQEFGVENLLDAIDCMVSVEPGNLIRGCLEKVRDHRGNAGSFDDLSMMAITFDNN